MGYIAISFPFLTLDISFFVLMMVVLRGFIWSIFSYSSRLIHRHWGSPVPNPNGSTLLPNTRKRKPCAKFCDCIIPLVYIDQQHRVPQSTRGIILSLLGHIRSWQVHDDVIQWRHYPRYWPFVREFAGPRRIPLARASDAELRCFLWSVPEQSVE